MRRQLRIVRIIRDDDVCEACIVRATQLEPVEVARGLATLGTILQIVSGQAACTRCTRLTTVHSLRGQ